MEEAIELALVDEQSYTSALVMPWQKPAAERSAATPMELGNADVSATIAASAAILWLAAMQKWALVRKFLARNLPTQRVVRRISVRNAQISHRPSMGR